MSIFQKFRMAMSRWMAGRNGADNLSLFTLIAGVILSIAGNIFGSGMINFLGFALYILTLFRMLSRNLEARAKENRKYIELTGSWTTKIRQFFRRMKNQKEYKYFKCPGCKQLLRLKRGSGEKNITCPKCGHQFQQKS